MNIWLLVFALAILNPPSFSARQGVTQNRGVELSPVGEVTKVSARKEAGFFWDYYVYVPRSLAEAPAEPRKRYIMVVPNNTGRDDDDTRVHDEYARKNVASFINFAEALKVIVLEPVFPRPKAQGRWKIYTHALDRDVMLTKDEKLHRLDLQLISMISDARRKLAGNGLETEEKVLMWGFSASGMFVNRFCLLHPRRVKAATVGSPGGWAMLPVASWQGQKLRYPIGIGDFKTVTKSEFDLEGFRQLTLYFFIGDRDTNDSVIFRDSYEKKDEEMIFRNFGAALVPRLRVAERVYHEAGCSGCRFVVYKDLGHETNREVSNDIRAFFRKAMEN